MALDETEIPVADVPDDPSDGTLPEVPPVIDDPQPAQSGAETDPEAETPAGMEPQP